MVFPFFDNFTRYWGMGILFERQRDVLSSLVFLKKNMYFYLENILWLTAIFAHLSCIPYNTYQLSRGGFHISRYFFNYLFLQQCYIMITYPPWKSNFVRLSLEKKKRWLVGACHQYFHSGVELVSCSFSNSLICS